MRAYLMFINKKRAAAEGLQVAEEVSEKRELTSEDYEDITDLHTVGFRYRM
jgi:hypothetical protein